MGVHSACRFKAVSVVILRAARAKPLWPPRMSRKHSASLHVEQQPARAGPGILNRDTIRASRPKQREAFMSPGPWGMGNLLLVGPKTGQKAMSDPKVSQLGLP
jgi:hypothetical protein